MTQLVNSPDQSKVSNKPYQKKLPTKATAKKSTKIAIKLANRGFKLIPCSLKTKVPCINWKTHPGCGFDEINQRLETSPDILWAIRCDKFSAYDFDCYSPSYGTEAKKLFYYFEKNCKIKQKTLNDGWHFLVRDELDNTPATDGVDRRGKDGIIFLYDDFLPDNLWSQIHDIDDFLSLIPYLKDVLPTHLLTNTQKKGKQVANGVWKQGHRNNSLNGEAFIGRTTGENERIVRAVIKASKSGLDDDEIIKVVASQNRGFVIHDSPKPNSALPHGLKDKTEKTTKTTESYDNILEYKKMDKLREPDAFIEGILLNNSFNSGTGPTKSGKSLTFLDLILGYARDKKVNIGIISTENDFETMLMHQIRVKDAEDYAKVFNPKIITRFDDKASIVEMIDEFLKRIETIIDSHKLKSLLVDPITSIF